MTFLTTSLWSSYSTTELSIGYRLRALCATFIAQTAASQLLFHQGTQIHARGGLFYGIVSTEAWIIIEHRDSFHSSMDQSLLSLLTPSAHFSANSWHQAFSRVQGPRSFIHFHQQFSAKPSRNGKTQSPTFFLQTNPWLLRNSSITFLFRSILALPQSGLSALKRPTHITEALTAAIISSSAPISSGMGCKSSFL